MSILILYATIEGQTGKICRFLETELTKMNLDVTMADAGDRAVEVDYTGIDTVILAAPVHERKHPKPFEVLVLADKDQLAKRRTLFLSISLKAAFDETREEAQDFADEMKLRTELTPDAELLVAGAVHPGSYDYYADQVLRHVILRGQEVDPTSDHEFTDWEALRSAVLNFVGAVNTPA